MVLSSLLHYRQAPGKPDNGYCFGIPKAEKHRQTVISGLTALPQWLYSIEKYKDTSKHQDYLLGSFADTF